MSLNADGDDVKMDYDKQCLEKHCVNAHSEYRKCLERIALLPSDKEPHCWGYYGEVIHCVDHCTDHKLWHHLK